MVGTVAFHNYQHLTQFDQIFRRLSWHLRRNLVLWLRDHVLTVSTWNTCAFSTHTPYNAICEASASILPVMFQPPPPPLDWEIPGSRWSLQPDGPRDDHAVVSQNHHGTASPEHKHGRQHSKRGCCVRSISCIRSHATPVKTTQTNSEQWKWVEWVLDSETPEQAHTSLNMLLSVCGLYASGQESGCGFNRYLTRFGCPDNHMVTDYRILIMEWFREICKYAYARYSPVMWSEGIWACDHPWFSLMC